jgi:hypothetical protein
LRIISHIAVVVIMALCHVHYIMTNEEFYDKEIAPVLLELGKKCLERDMGLFAYVTFDDEGGGRTLMKPANAPGILRWLDVLAQCREDVSINIDKFMIASMRDGKERGHSSAILTILEH